MRAGKVIALIVAIILLVWGFLMTLGAFSYTPAKSSWIIFGLIFIGIGAALFFLALRKPKGAISAEGTSTTYKIDLPGNVKLDTIKCKSCGGALTSDNIKMVAGAPVVTCPFCHTTYQLTEEPKW
jgi:hypothetical protein